jgi:hypothetical protein
MERVLKPASRLVAAAGAVIVGAIALYLVALLHVYVIGWVVQLIQKIF